MCNLSLVTLKIQHQNLDWDEEFLIWLAFKGFLQSVEFKLSKMVFKSKHPLFNEQEIFSLYMSILYVSHSGHITNLLLLFKAKSRGFHLLLWFIIVVLNLLLQWCLILLQRRLILLFVALCFSSSVFLNVLSAIYGSEVPFHTGMFEGEEDGIIIH